MSRAARDLFDCADRLIVDASTWSGDGLTRLQELAAPGRHDPAGRQRLRARPPVALAGGDRLDLRRPGLPAVPALAAADRGHLLDPRRDGRAGLDQHGQADLPRRLAGLAAAGCRVHKPLAPVAGPRPGAGAAARGAVGSTEPAMGRGVGGDAVGRPGGGRGGRPAGRLADPAGHDPAGRTARRATRLGAAGRRDGRGRDRPCPGLAGRRRGDGAPLPRAAADRCRPAGRVDRGRAARPGRGRGAAVGGGDHRPAGGVR